MAISGKHKIRCKNVLQIQIFVVYFVEKVYDGFTSSGRGFAKQKIVIPECIGFITMINFLKGV